MRLFSPTVLAALVATFLPSIQSSPEVLLQVPDDVTWFVPGQVGWLCDYNYVQNEVGDFALKLVPRNDGMGKILVYGPPAPDAKTVKTSQRGGQAEAAKFSQALTYAVTAIRGQSRRGNDDFPGRASESLIVAVNQWGELDRTFAVTARFGDSTAFVRFATNFTLGQEIMLRDKRYEQDSTYDLKVASIHFPGLVGTDETIHAYG